VEKKLPKLYVEGSIPFARSIALAQKCSGFWRNLARDQRKRVGGGKLLLYPVELRDLCVFNHLRRHSHSSILLYSLGGTDHAGGFLGERWLGALCMERRMWRSRPTVHVAGQASFLNEPFFHVETPTILSPVCTVSREPRDQVSQI
jgi:hypothetical protein